MNAVHLCAAVRCVFEGSGREPLGSAIENLAARRDLRPLHAKGNPTNTIVRETLVFHTVDSHMASSTETIVDESWRVQLFIAARDGNLEVT